MTIKATFPDDGLIMMFGDSYRRPVVGSTRRVLPNVQKAAAIR